MMSRLSQHDSELVGALLAESKVAPNDALRGALLDLRALALDDAPAPSPEIAEHFDNVSSIASRRWRKAGLVAVGVVVVMGLGVGSAAAISPQFRQAASETVTEIVERITGKSDEAPGRVKNEENGSTGNNGVGNDSTDPGVTDSGNGEKPSTPTKAPGSKPTTKPAPEPSTNKPDVPNQPDTPAKPEVPTPPAPPVPDKGGNNTDATDGRGPGSDPAVKGDGKKPGKPKG